MKYALIGCGRISANHIKAARTNNLDIVAICDIDPSKFDIALNEASYNKLTHVQRYKNYKQMLSDHPDIELVAIAVESGKHAEIALSCIDAGKHVIIEKPIALSMADANEIIDRSCKKNVKVAVCHQNRFNTAVLKTRSALEAGRFGKISHGSISIRWNRNEKYYKQASWRGTWDRDGGCMMNQCIHGIDLLRWMMEKEAHAISVCAQTRQRLHDYLESEDLGVAIVSFSDGSVGLIEGTTNVYPESLEETFYLFGENATVKIGGISTNTINVWNFADESKGNKKSSNLKEKIPNYYGNGHIALYADMIDAIKQDRTPFIDAVAGRNALEIVLAIYKSQKTGLPVHLPLDDFASIDMKKIL